MDKLHDVTITFKRLGKPWTSITIRGYDPMEAHTLAMRSAEQFGYTAKRWWMILGWFDRLIIEPVAVAMWADAEACETK